MIPIFSIQGKGHNDISTIGHIISKYDKKCKEKVILSKEKVIVTYKKYKEKVIVLYIINKQYKTNIKQI